MTNHKEVRAERRKYIRLHAPHMLTYAKYKLVEPGVRKAAEGMLKNYSAGGVLFESKVCYAIGDLLRLEISIPGWERFKSEFYKEEALTPCEPIVVLAVVVRVENIIVGDLYDTGVCFVGIDEGHRWAMIKQVKSQLGRE